MKIPPLKLGTKLASNGLTNTSVYEYKKDQVVKITPVTENEVLPGVDVPSMTYVANCRSILVEGDMKLIFKERVYSDSDLYSFMSEMELMWDESLVHTKDMFSFMDDFLRKGSKNIIDKRAVQAFYKYLSCDNTTAVKAHRFIQLCQLVQELKDNGIYNIDWNVENFGLKNNQLCLVELGGAKLKTRQL